jgi:hypothetical protein
MRSTTPGIAAALVVLAVAGYWGGGGAVPGTGPSAISGAQSGTISSEYFVPAAAPKQRARSPRYVSASTYQAVLVVKPQNQTP